MNDTLKMYGSIGSEIINRYFVVAMCFKRQPRWRRLQTINCLVARPCFVSIATLPRTIHQDFGLAAPENLATLLLHRPIPGISQLRPNSKASDSLVPMIL